MQESKPSNHIYTYSMWSYFAAAHKNNMNSVLLSCSDIIRTSINVIVQFPKYEINIVSFCSYINYVQSVFDHIESGKPFCNFTILLHGAQLCVYFFITMIFFTLKVVNCSYKIWIHPFVLLQIAYLWFTIWRVLLL